VRLALAKNPKVTPEILSVLKKVALDLQSASDPSTSLDQLKSLSLSDYGDIRCEVALNPSTPQEILKQLSEEEYDDVREAVAENPSTPKAVLRLLAEDDSEYVRFRVEL
jgi:hypothetical protein